MKNNLLKNESFSCYCDDESPGSCVPSQKYTRTEVIHATVWPAACAVLFSISYILIKCYSTKVVQLSSIKTCYCKRAFIVASDKIKSIVAVITISTKNKK